MITYVLGYIKQTRNHMTEIPSQSNLIEMPDSFRDAAAEAREENKAKTEQELATRSIEAAAGAQLINDTRPEGVAPTLPTGEVPVYRELTASTYRSRR